MKDTFEFVEHVRIKHVKVLVNRIVYCHPHVHSDFEIAILLRGKGILTVNNTRYEMEPGEAVFVNTYESHSYFAFPEKENFSSKEKEESTPVFLIFQISRHFLMEYYPEIRNTIFQSGRLSTFFGKEEQERAKSLLFSAALEYFQGGEHFAFDFVARIALVLKLCFERIPHKLVSDKEREAIKRKYDRTQRILSEIDENYSGGIRLEDISKKEGITPTHLSHFFSESFGLTFQQYVNLKRLEKSILLMQDERKSLVDIAFESGFSDPKYMNQLFRKYFHCKPKEFRDHSHAEFRNLTPVSPNQQEFLFADADALQAIEDYLRENGDGILGKDPVSNL